MAKLTLVKASTDVTLYVFIQDSSSTTGAGLTGLVYNSASLVCYYVRPLAAAAALTLATQTVTGAHSDGGFVEVSSANMPGWYRLDLSDAVCATGVDFVGLTLKGATNMAPVNIEIQLTSMNLNDAVRGGLTALPNANAAAIGGLMTAPTVANVGSNVSGYELGAVWFDTGGAAGAVSYTNGTTHNPCSSPTNTKTLLTNLNLKVVRVVNASSYTAEATYTGYSFIGEKWTFAPASQQIINCYLKGATITSGTFNAASTGCQFDHCHLNTVTMPAGNTATSATTFYQCGLNGTFTINAAGIFNFINCYEEVAAGGEFTLDFDAVGATTVHMDNFTGLLTVANMAAGDVLELSGWGRLTIAASCTAGTVYVSGNIILVNGGSGQTINDTSRYNEDQAVATVNGLAANVITAAATATDFGTEVFNAVVTSQLTESYAADNTAPTVAQALFLIQQMLSEKAVASTTLTVKKLDGSTTAATFTLDSASAPTSITRTT